MIQLTVKVDTTSLNSAVILTDCQTTDSVLTIKERIHEKVGIPPSEQRLFSVGGEITNEHTLHYYNIRRGNRTIKLREHNEFEHRRTDDDIQIHITSLGGGSSYYYVNPKTLVEELENYHYKRTGDIPGERQYLVSGKQPLFLQPHYTFEYIINASNRTSKFLQLHKVHRSQRHDLMDAPTNAFNGYLFGVNDCPTDEEFLSQWRHIRLFGNCIVDTTHRDLLSLEQRKTCMELVDDLFVKEATEYEKLHEGKPLCGISVKLDWAIVKQLCENVDNKASVLMQRVRDIYRTDRNDDQWPNILLHCIRGPAQVADWHLSHNNTAHIALNDTSEYEGGRLCYFSPDSGVEVLSELNAGDIVRHVQQPYDGSHGRRCVLHASTRLTRGTQYLMTLEDYYDRSVITTSMKELSLEDTQSLLIKLSEVMSVHN